MANHLSAASIQTLLSSTAGALKVGDLNDLLDAMDRIHITRGPDRDRTVESTMTTIFGATVQP